MEKLKSREIFTREKYEESFKGKISERMARKDIAQLIAGGWVQKEGTGPSTKYMRTNIELP
ncbi:MAG: hypothetical protein LBT25_08215 [Candidatus Symbiothrix sp.]|jgi:predicted HTH transcriptional regulator|nr:hypothetical protein [Candidatus Symbiothrix sp.]